MDHVSHLSGPKCHPGQIWFWSDVSHLPALLDTHDNLAKESATYDLHSFILKMLMSKETWKHHIQHIYTHVS